MELGPIDLLVPAVWAGVLLLAGWLGRKTDPQKRAWLGALALGGGFLLGYGLFLGVVPAFPPTSSEPALFYLALAATLVGMVEGQSLAARWVLRSGVSLLAPWLLLRRMAEQWEQTRVAVTLLSFGLAILAAWQLTDAWARRRPGASVPLVLWLWATATAVALVLGRTAKLAQLSGVLAGALGAAIVVAWLRPALVLTGGAGVTALLVGALCVAGSELAQLPREAAALLLAVPLAAWLGELPKVTRMRPFQAACARMLLAALPVALALWLVYQSMPEPYEG